MRNAGRVTVLLIVLVLAGSGAGGMLLPRRIVADASTYVLMAGSLAGDRDLRWEPRDLDRARVFDGALTPPSLSLPAGLFLVERHGEYRYAKPLVYPLIAAPFVGVLGLRGFYVLNALAFAGTVLLGAWTVADRLGRARALAASAVVFTLSAAPVYLLWVDPFLVLTALVACGVAAWRHGRPGLAGAALGVVVAARFTYAPLLAVPSVLYRAAGRRRDVATFLVAAALVLAASTGLTYLLLGQWSPYVGARNWYPDALAVPWGPSAGNGSAMSMGKGAIAAGWTPPHLAEVVRGLALDAVGRASGFVLYFPAFAACALWARRIDAEKALWLAAVAAILVLSALVVPHNPIGGTHTLGNRYFVMLPIATLFVDRGPWRAVAWRSAVTALLLLPPCRSWRTRSSTRIIPDASPSRGHIGRSRSSGCGRRASRIRASILRTAPRSPAARCSA